jgi:hypothetical protein
LPENVVAVHVEIGHVCKSRGFSSRDPQFDILALAAGLKGGHRGSKVVEFHRVDPKSVSPGSNQSSGIPIERVYICGCVSLGKSNDQTILGHDVFSGVIGFVELESSLATVGGFEVLNGRISELFSQKAALFIHPKSIVLEY